MGERTDQTLKIGTDNKKISLIDGFNSTTITIDYSDVELPKELIKWNGKDVEMWDMMPGLIEIYKKSESKYAIIKYDPSTMKINDVRMENFKKEPKKEASLANKQEPMRIA